MIIGNVRYQDLEEIRYLQPEGWSDIIPDFEFYLKTPFCNPIKIEINDKIVGVGVSIIYNSTAWLAHIIVDSSHRRRGIGTRIVQELLEFLNKFPIKSFSLVATELGHPIYLKAGFRVISEYLTFKRQNPWKGKPDSKKIIPFHENYRLSINDLDKRISGENREKLINPVINNCLLYVDDNKVLGYYLPDLKEGPIFADTIEAGFELMNFKYATFDKAVLPQENKRGIKFLKQNGFIESNTKATRMILGKGIEWEPEKIYSRIGGNFG